jgi:multidrug efflux system outer membrane protein
MGPNYQRPEFQLSDSFKSASQDELSSTQLTNDWWKLYNDKDLDRLEEEATKANQDIKVAIAKVEEARASTRAISSQLYPTIDFNPSATRSRSPGGHGSASTSTNIQLPFDLNYEIDIWGRVQKAFEAAKAQINASLSDFVVVLQTVETDLAEDYFNLRYLDIQDDILTKTLATYKREVELLQTQFNAGLIQSSDLLQAQALMNSTITQQLELHRKRVDLEHAIAILIGRVPDKFSLSPRKFDLSPPVIPAGLPADILRHRPDVAEAEQNLIAACAQIGIAKANFFPTFKLTGAAGFESVSIQNAVDWQNRLWSLGPSVSLPVFNGGQLQANLDQARATYTEKLATYHSVVLGAIRDVEDALTDLHLQADEAISQNKAVAESQENLLLVKLQYQKGLNSYLQVIDAERTALSNELSGAQIENQRLVTSVILIKALGGGWSTNQYW